MRFLKFALPILLFSLIANPLFAARVLVPKTEGTQAAPNLGLLPSTVTGEKPKDSPTKGKPELKLSIPTIPLQAQQPTAPEVTSTDLGFSEIDMSGMGLPSSFNLGDFFKKMTGAANLPEQTTPEILAEIRKNMPHFANYSDDQLKSMLSGNIPGAGNMQFVQDPATGKYKVKIDTKDALGSITGPVRIVPGGSLPNPELTEEEKTRARLLAKGIMLPRVDPKNLPYPQLRAAAQAERDKIEQKYDRPALILHMRELGTFSKNPLDKTILIGVMDSYTWGNKDLKDIQKSFGYAREDVPKKCQIRLGIQIKTTDEANAEYHSYLFTGEKEDAAINGVVTGLDISSVAVCYPPDPMPRQVTLFSYGDKFSIPLKEGHCDVQAPPSVDAKKFVPKRAGIRYDGDGQISCAFQ